MDEKKRTAVVVLFLAAGLSTRMGRNKLLLPVGEKLIVQKTLDKLVNSQAREIIAVIGAKALEVEKAISGYHVTTVFNPNYACGMSTSLSAGLRLVGNNTSFIMVALGDQPCILTQTYDLLISTTEQTSRGLLVPTYNGIRGNPILVSTKYRSDLYAQFGDIGGRRLLSLHADDVLEVPVADEGVVINVNSEDDYRNYVTKC
ncbi:MAG: nucleotidyltransferase family protein [Dehalococcoidia bacterium]|nr:nucleotidyltransferase family protein [Dehalococcoidia bacterium]